MNTSLIRWTLLCIVCHTFLRNWEAYKVETWYAHGEWLVGWLCWGLTSQSTIFQSCRDGAIASWVINQYFRGVKCLAQGHNTVAVGLEPRTSRSGVRHSTTEPPRSPHMESGLMYFIYRNQDAAAWPLFFLSCFQIFVTFFSGTGRNRKLKLYANMNDGSVCHVYWNQAPDTYSSLYFFFLSLHFSVTNLSFQIALQWGYSLNLWQL